MVAGDFDYLVKLIIGSIDEHRDTLARLANIHYIANVKTYVAIRNMEIENGIYIKD
jgi:hypothetical protein